MLNKGLKKRMEYSLYCIGYGPYLYRLGDFFRYEFKKSIFFLIQLKLGYKKYLKIKNYEFLKIFWQKTSTKKGIKFRFKKIDKKRQKVKKKE